MTAPVLVAGATGDLGQRVVRELLRYDTRVRVLTRPGTSAAHRIYDHEPRAEVLEADYIDTAALTAAVSGVEAVVSAVSGTRAVIVDAQRALLAAAITAEVPRSSPPTSPTTTAGSRP